MQRMTQFARCGANVGLHIIGQRVPYIEDDTCRWHYALDLTCPVHLVKGHGNNVPLLFDVCENCADVICSLRVVMRGVFQADGVLFELGPGVIFKTVLGPDYQFSIPRSAS